jgi:plastocyanin
MTRIAGALVAVGATLALASTAPAAMQVNTLIGTDGPGFTITMSKKTVRAGTYVITIRDRSAIHNFHLTGPGVDKRTSLGKIYTTIWKVTLKKGTYKFVCDPHAAIMKGILKVT